MAHSEADLSRAINEYHSGLYISKKAVAIAINILPTTVRYQLASRTSYT